MIRFESLLRAAFWAALIFTLAMALLPRPPQLPGSPSDKVQHVVAFLTLTSLALASNPRVSRIGIALGLSAFGGLIELLQMIPALNRDAQWLDWAADSCAVAAVMLLATLFKRLR